jgi:hypothetical protein
MSAAFPAESETSSHNISAHAGQTVTVIFEIGAIDGAANDQRYRDDIESKESPAILPPAANPGVKQRNPASEADPGLGAAAGLAPVAASPECPEERPVHGARRQPCAPHSTSGLGQRGPGSVG